MWWRSLQDLIRRWFLKGGTAEIGWLAGRLGNAGERLAAKHLRSLGLRILFRSYRTPLGEIDLIARDGNTVVFVEVKTRRGTWTGPPADAVDDAKQKQLTRLALSFLKHYQLLNHRARFDVVAIVWPKENVAPQITYYRAAFEARGEGQMFS